MNNPYKVLNISQDATNAEIVKAQIIDKLIVPEKNGQ